LRRWFRSAAAVAAVGCTVAAAGAPFYADGPPPGRTGGFNEPTCGECHQHNPLNDPLGMLSLAGLPPSYEPNRVYHLTVTLARPGMLAGGFQLAARSHDAYGRQAGDLAPADDRTTVPPATLPALQYLQHTRPGTALTVPDTARWTFMWRAPAGLGPVVFHVAANAANEDNSELGDFIYTLQRVVAPAPSR
jgi:hypothetical protein